MHAQHLRAVRIRFGDGAAQPCSARSISCGGAVMVVPSRVVVPWRACRRATCRAASPPFMMSMPPAPCVQVDKAGQDH
jgi:hypothetical protein